MNSNKTCSTYNDNFWKSGTVLLVLLALHLIRDRCIPPTHQKQLRLFFDHRKEADKDSEAVSGSDCDSGGLHNSDTDTSQGVQDADNHEKEDPVLYEDEHLIIFSKSVSSPKPKTLLAFCHVGLKYDGTPFANEMLGQYLAAGIVYVLQLYVMYRAALQARETTSTDVLRRILSAVDLVLPMGVTVLSTMFFISDSAILREDCTDASRGARAWVLPVLDKAICVDVLGLLYVFTTSL